MEMRLPVSGEISGLSLMRATCADTDWRLVSKWNGAAVNRRMTSVATARITCERRSGSGIGRSGRQTAPDGRGLTGRESARDGNLNVHYQRWRDPSPGKEHGYAYL